MESFGQGARAAVIGASGGIGGAVADALDADPAFAEVLRFSRHGPARIDATDEMSVEAAAAQAGPLDLVFVAVGLLHDGPAFQPEKDLRALDADRLARSFLVNAIGPALVAKHFLPLLPRKGRGVFACLSARVGSIADNQAGGWYGYRASKAALNMLLKNAALETARKRPDHVILALQPGTVDTALSKPFQSAARTLMTPQESAAALLAVVDRARPEWSGGLFDWRGARIPF
ncbi:MAG: SDR family NAD(P)-dependent oxidoreductase [Rhodobacteraceae bacterium]|nr:MAG: SDR family NAD(P)-dependent oxidoreductase [Paracoccaceae bacterium]